MPSKVIIIDYGSQVTQLIARRVREAGVYSEIHACDVPAEKVKAMRPQAVILSGGPASVGGKDAPVTGNMVRFVFAISAGKEFHSKKLPKGVEPAVVSPLVPILPFAKRKQ